MATNSNNNGGNGQRPAGSGRKPSGSAQRPTGQRPAGSGQRPAGSGQRTGAANGQKRMSAKQRATKKKGYHLWHRDRSDPVHGSIIVSGNDSYQQ